MPTSTLATNTPPGRPLVVVGIGASAGGLEAAAALLDHLPADSGMAFILIQHLDPSQPSLMAELLSRHSRMTVRTAEDGAHLEPNCFHVIPPNIILTVQKGVLKAAAPANHSTVRTHVDTFFRSLAEDQGELAIGVILSGAGSDGTLGLRAIKENGGLTIAQSPSSAKFDSMPQNAVGSGMVDLVLPVEDIPAKLVEHARYLHGRTAPRPTDGDGQDVAKHLPRICQILQQATGHDFSGYKLGTMLRRIGRRVQVQHLDSVAAYLAFLEETPDEAAQLFKDLLIGVTQFFRDPDAFDVLSAQALPAILQGRKSEDSVVRVWVPGCATGEEAYSLAMLITERMADLAVEAQVQVFATDIDNSAIATARLGRYPASLVEPLSPERRERFFVRNGDGYQVNRQIRDLCIFSTHNLVRDPPFSSLDLISCRNLLIYMDVWLQKRMIPLFHYALAPGGYLFLGTSEGLGNCGDLFHDVDEKHRLFQRTQGPARASVIFPLTVAAQPRGAPSLPARREDPAKARDVGAAIDRLVLEYAPPCVVIDARGDIVYSVGETSPYLQQPTGSPTLSVIEQARKGLRSVLRAAIREAATTLKTVVHHNVPVRTPAGVLLIDLIVRPVPDTSPGNSLFAVIFQGARTRTSPDAPLFTEESAAQQLEVELKATQLELQSTVETLERASQDSKSSNEELLSLNEEMQSANEELQSSKEEMQSVNEELSTVNSELNRKVGQLDGANADLQNLIRSTEIATLFLDRDLRIKRFTPAAALIFRLLDADIGRPLGDFAPRIADVDLLARMNGVLDTLTPTQQQVYLPDTRAWFLMRLLPSRTVADAIDGVVATFVDITVLKQAEDALRQSEERARQLTDAIPALVWTARPDGVWDFCNERVREYGGFARKPDGTWDWAAALHPEDAPRALAAWRHAVETLEPYQVEHRLAVAPGLWRWHLGHAVAIRDQHGRAVIWSGTLTDVHDLRTAQAANASAENAREIAERVARNKDEFLAVLSHELRTPLTPVMMTLGMLDADPAIDPAIRESLQMIKRNVELETRLIDDLLDMTRIASGKIELDLRPVDLRVILHRAAEVVMPEVHARQLEFAIEDGASPLLVSADAVRLQQAFWNLLRNAVKFTSAAGRVTLRAVKARGVDGADGVAVEISDTGIGIAPDVLPCIFDAFQQGGRTTTRRFGGLGLGLTITRTLVTLHGGTVEARSAGEAQGATFAVWLPLLPPHAPALMEPYAAAAGSTATRALRILLVEDHSDTAHVMIRLLATHGHAVAHAADLATALRLATEDTPTPFDLLISDIGLPDGSGLDLIRALRQRGLHIPGIALSGYGQEQEILASRQAGYDQHLVKPVSIPRLEAAIAALTADEAPVPP